MLFLQFLLSLVDELEKLIITFLGVFKKVARFSQAIIFMVFEVGNTCLLLGAISNVND